MSSSSSSSSNDSDYLLKEKIRKIRTFKERVYPDFYDDDEFSRKFRMTKVGFYFVLDLIKNDLKHNDNRGYPLSPEQKLLAALRYYATGTFQSVTGELIGVHQTVAGKTIHKVSRSLARLSKDYIKMPDSHGEINNLKQKFHNQNGIPKCIGCIDGTHIPIKSPGGEKSELYRNRKGFFSINCQVVCDYDTRIRDIVARWFGSAHDQTIFNFSNLRARFEAGEFSDSLLIGDAGYGCKNYLITPLRNPRTRAEKRYNKSLSSTRSKIEMCFGKWKRRFPVLSIKSQLDISNFLTIIIATAVLHNITILLNEPDPAVDASIIIGEFVNVDCGQPLSTEYARNTAIRDSIVRNFE